MLHLRRRVGEEIIINDQVRVTVLGIRGNQVQLGVTAPRWVPVDRKEIHDRRMQQAQQAASTATPASPLPELAGAASADAR